MQLQLHFMVCRREEIQSSLPDALLNHALGSIRASSIHLDCSVFTAEHALICPLIARQHSMHQDLTVLPDRPIIRDWLLRTSHIVTNTSVMTCSLETCESLRSASLLQQHMTARPVSQGHTLRPGIGWPRAESLQLGSLSEHHLLGCVSAPNRITSPPWGDIGSIPSP